MKAYDEIRERQLAKRSAFTLMNNIRDHCQQPDAKKLLLFSLATYCDGKGICWPGNEELVKITRKSERTIRRMLSELKEDGEIDVLTPGTGRGQKRKISLRRYAKPDKAMTAKPDKAMSCLNRPRSLGKTSRNSHDNSQEQPYQALSDSTPPTSSNGESEKRVVKDYQNQDTPAQDHVKWPEFAAWCRSKGGTPNQDGFWKWLCGQKPQWRNKRRSDFDEHGYTLDGKFLPAHVANAMAARNPELATKFVRAIKRDGRTKACA